MVPKSMKIASKAAEGADEHCMTHTLVMGSTRHAGLGMSAISSKLAAEHAAAGGQTVLFDVGHSFESLTRLAESAKLVERG